MLDKAIEHGKEYQKPYQGANACGRSCRNHGNCNRCSNSNNNRNYRNMKLEEKIKFEVENNNK